MRSEVSSLGIWIDRLRDRLALGELDKLEPLELGYGTAILPARVMIEIMIDDFDELDDVTVTWDTDDDRLEHRRTLLEEFRRLRDLIY